MKAKTPADGTVQPSIPTVDCLSRQSLSSIPFSVLWRTALVRLPRAVPIRVLKYTSPDGPHPFIVSLPSRGKHLIPLYVFVSSKIQPEDAASIPIIIDFHGGGFFLGSCLEQAPFCCKMARDLNCVVVSVDYRMGPIDKFPAATEDAEDVINAVLDDSAPGYKELRLAIATKVAENIKALEKSASRESLRANKKAISRESFNSSQASSVNEPSDHLKPPTSDPAGASQESLNIPTTSRPPAVRNPSRNSLKPTRTISNESTSNGKRGGTRAGIKRTLSRESLKRVVSRDNFRRKGKSASTNLEQVVVDLDKTRVAVSGFSSGGNLALGMGMSFSPPETEGTWPCRFPENYPHRIPLLLYYPSVDSRQLPSERKKPAGMPAGSKFWAEVNDLLMPTYLPREQAADPRASPGLVDVSKCLHPQARMLLVLPEMDNLADQCEIWVKRVEREGRSKDLRVERFPGMKHGWTQMPESWLNEEERKTRSWIFEETVSFVSSLWEGGDIDGLENIVEHESDAE